MRLLCLNQSITHLKPILSPKHPASTCGRCRKNFAFRNFFSQPVRTLAVAPPLPFRIHRQFIAMGTTSTEPLVQVKENIELTEIETKIFDRLIGTLRHFNLSTELRVAGGWVRDKLLGKDCYDIDIAIDDMLGSEFVDKVREYLSTVGEAAQGVGVIQRNPDQSKHLETARMRLFDLWIDFVNLRCEDYSENSRIPTMKFGTAKEDAYRRDLTINSLFYNINTSSVEDLTGRGIEDLKFGRIVTPLPPKATFLDDPLRVLRAIRFGSRFEFPLVEELKEAAACDEVKNALAAKISKERIGTEIDLMISGNQPVLAMTYIADLTLFWIVFVLPTKVEPKESEGCYRYDTCNHLECDRPDTCNHLECDRLCVAYLDAAWNLIEAIGCHFFSNEERRLSLYAALFLPLRKYRYVDGKDKKVPVVNFIFKVSLKQKASNSETVMKIHSSLEKFIILIRSLTSGDGTQVPEVDWVIDLGDMPDTSRLRVAAGLVLREIKQFWRVAVLMATMLYPADVDFTQDFLDKQFQLEKRTDLFKAVENAIINLGLDGVWDVKPLINGNEIMRALQLKSGGPLVREWQQKLVAWQLAHPTGTSEECLEWLKQAQLKRAKLA